MYFIFMRHVCIKYVLFYILVNKKLSETLKIKKTLRIHGGRDIQGDEYPFIVMLAQIDTIYNWADRLCTGAMLTEQWGLTAAHCSLFRNKYYVWYGNFTISPVNSQLMTEILKFVIHPSFRLLTLNNGKKDLQVENDVGLFRIHKTDFKHYGVLLAADYASLLGHPVTYVGGGLTRNKMKVDDVFRPLQVGEATIVSCDEELRSKSKYILCLAPKCSNRLQRPWYGDSGGPLLCDGNIIGVCSYGIESKVMSKMAYAPVSPYIDWIYHVINDTK